MFILPKVTRTKDERLAEIERKIEKHKADIASLEVKKRALLAPKKKAQRTTAKTVVELAKKAGMKPTEMLEKLGLKDQAEE